MRLVIADTGPVNYLLLIGHLDILPVLFEKVVLPSEVRDELTNAETPVIVQDWMVNAPSWVEVLDAPMYLPSEAMAGLGPGETAAITLAIELRADLLLMDDRRAVAVALQRGLAVTGTLGLLVRAAKRGLLDLADAFERLKDTNFRYRQETMDALLHDAGGRA